MELLSVVFFWQETCFSLCSCGLWVLLHSLSVRIEDGESQFAFQAICEFVHNFFICEECRQHFYEMCSRYVLLINNAYFEGQFSSKPKESPTNHYVVIHMTIHVYFSYMIHYWMIRSTNGWSFQLQCSGLEELASKPVWRKICPISNPLSFFQLT